MAGDDMSPSPFRHRSLAPTGRLVQSTGRLAQSTGRLLRNAGRRLGTAARRSMTRTIGLAQLIVATAWPSLAAAQTINGTLMDLDTDAPIPLGLVMMFTESGDSIGSTITDAGGRFSLSSPRSGTFLLLAAALGYRETPAGVFELGQDGVMTVEYRLPAQPLPIDEIIVSLDRPALQHSLVRKGFVRRLQRGMGVFVTPHEIERSSAMSTEMLLGGIPGVTVSPVFAQRGALTVPRPDIGEHVRLRSVTGEWCYPTVFLDGIRVAYDIEAGLTLSQLVDLQSVDGIEVYRRPLEVPPEYATGQATCGVLVFWSRAGTSSGQRVTDVQALGLAGSQDLPVPEGEPLPSVDEEGPPPASGERIRMDLDPAVRASIGLSSPWEGTFLMVRDGELVANDAALGRAVAVPLSAVQTLHVRRERAGIHAVRRGAIAGAAFGTGMWLQLRILCRSGCEGVLGSAWLPATVTGLFFGALFAGQGPGEHWVSARLPVPGGSGPGGGFGPGRGRGPWVGSGPWVGHGTPSRFRSAGAELALRLPVGGR
jgi:hypothetical protein